MEDEVDDGEVWEGVNNSDIEGDIQEFTYISSNVHPVHSGIDADIDSDETSRVVTFILVLLSKWSSRYNISLAAITALITGKKLKIQWLFYHVLPFSTT